MEIKKICLEITQEITQAMDRIDNARAQDFIQKILNARRIFFYGVGREGLMLKSFAMRLMHLGLQSFVVGDMTTYRMRNGDLLITSSGPGYFSTVAALMQVAREVGAEIVFITAHAGSALAQKADLIVHVPGQTMAHKKGAEQSSIQPMGSLYEQMQLVYFDALVVALVQEMKTSYEAMTERHTNLE